MSKRKLSDAAINELCAAYQNGTPCSTIQSHFGVSAHTLGAYLRLRNIPFRNKHFALLSDEQINRLVSQYRDGVRPKHLCLQFGVSKGTLLNHLRRNHVPNLYYKSGYVDYFRSIDNEHKAYWLGFLAADGCITSHKKLLSLTLSGKDKTHVVLFKDAVKSHRPIYNGLSRSLNGVFPRATINVVSEGMIQDLAALGVRDRKTETIEWPSIDPALTRHYVRGYFDGDGGWYVDKRSKQMTFHCIGKTAFMNIFRSSLTKATFISETKLSIHRRSPSVASVRYSGNRQCLQIVTWLYENATVFLPRKRDIVVKHYASLPLYDVSFLNRGK